MKVLLLILSSVIGLGCTQMLNVPPPGPFGRPGSKMLSRPAPGPEMLNPPPPYIAKYFLWTKSNPKKAQLLVSGNSTNVKKSYFRKANPTRIIIHGTLESNFSEVCTTLRDSYLKIGAHNVICVDWSPIASSGYGSARPSAPSVGMDLAKFIQFLSDSIGMSIKKKLIVVGYGLGAHVAGFAGKTLKQSKNTLAVIVACDPTNVLFNYEDCSSRLCNTDADFVESIQTSAGKIGFLRPIGDGTYYPNGGEEQPGCGNDFLGICAHQRSYLYFAEAITKNNFRTKRCSGYNQCEDKYSNVKMGSTKSFSQKGMFTVPVNSKSPYGTASTSIFGR